MEGYHTEYGIQVNRTRYGWLHTIEGMAKPPPRQPDVHEVLWENCLTLMMRFGPERKENLNWFARETKIGPGSASRIKAKKTAVGLGVLAKIAKRFHLLMPDLDPDNAPVAFLSDSEKALYDRLKKAHAVANAAETV